MPRRIYTPNPQQESEEFKWWIENFVKGRESVLEIGSSKGISLANMGVNLVPGGRIRAIDLGVLHHSGDEEIDARKEISWVIDLLKNEGFDAEVFFGDSHSPEAIAFAKAGAPYDAIFIDGDHTYEGVLEDFINFWPFTGTIGLHDIGHIHERGPRKLWAELLLSASPGVEMYSLVNWIYGGIGVVRKR